ncbi:MAG: molybdopterin-dependent oxidoreductase [Thermodesulfobacteriota bacterium]
MKKNVYGICGMCTVRCPMMSVVEDDKVLTVHGNPHAGGVAGALCARGAAGLALVNDDERPQFPMIRAGARGEGKWRRVSWDEALGHVAERLQKIKAEHGARSILLSDRGGPFREIYRTFLRGLGTPNYCNHDAACARNVQHAALSVFGFDRKSVGYDLKNAKHVVLQTRNIFEAINVKEVNDLLDARANGCKITCIDVRASVSACKADTFLLIRPGTDYAFNLAVINELLNKGLYDKAFAQKWIKDLDALIEFAAPYTPAWAEAQTGIPAASIEKLAKELSQAAPAVIWHPGWMTARYSDSFYMSRTAYIISALLGVIGAKGGLPLASGAGDVGKKGLKDLMAIYPKPEEKRVDGVGWMEERTHFDTGPGLVNLAYEAMVTGDPYPIKAYIAHRHDPLMAFPDPGRLKAMWDNLDLLVSVTFSWSDTAWHADVVLPLSPYLERESTIACKKGCRPYFFVRKRAAKPRFDTRAEWEIYCGLAKKMGLTEMAFESIEDIWKFQLEGTGIGMGDFEATGMVQLTDKAFYREVDEKTFKTPSGKIEIINEKLEKDGALSLAPYVSPERPPEGTYRVTFGRVGVHTQGHTVNNPLLNAQMSENLLWINEAEAKKLGIADGEYVEVSAPGHGGRIKAFVTPFMHPEAVFMVHGFGHTLPVESRARGKGVADNELMPGGISKRDKAGGAVAMQEHFVTVRRAS